MYRSGTEEEYSELQQLFEDIISYNKNFVGATELRKELNKRKDEEDKKKGIEMRQAAMEGQTSMCILEAKRNQTPQIQYPPPQWMWTGMILLRS